MTSASRNANYDEAKANPYPNLPPLLMMNDGTKVTSWRNGRSAAPRSRRCSTKMCTANIRRISPA